MAEGPRKISEFRIEASKKIFEHRVREHSNFGNFKLGNFDSADSFLPSFLPSLALPFDSELPSFEIWDGFEKWWDLLVKRKMVREMGKGVVRNSESSDLKIICQKSGEVFEFQFQFSTFPLKFPRALEKVLGIGPKGLFPSGKNGGR